MKNSNLRNTGACRVKKVKCLRNKNLVLILMIIGVLVVFVGYRQVDVWRTDTDAPVISIDDTQMLQVSVQTPKNELLQGVTASDRRDGDLTQSLVVESVRLIDSDGLVAVRYAVADLSGNVAKADRTVQYTDYESPKFSLSRPLVYELYQDFDVLNAVFARDVLDGDIQHRVRANALEEESIYSQGKHNVHLQVSNSLGDTSEIIVPVEVLEAGTYDASLTLTDYLIYLPQGSTFDSEKYLGDFIYKAVKTSLHNGLPDRFSLEVKGDVQTGTPGVYPVEYLVTYIVNQAADPEYNQKVTGYSKLIVVVEG